MDELEVLDVQCECGHRHRFAAPRALRGGLTNCPACGKAVPVPGGREGLFWLIVGGATAVVLGISGVLFAAAGPVAALVALLIGAVVIGLGVLAM